MPRFGTRTSSEHLVAKMVAELGSHKPALNGDEVDDQGLCCQSRLVNPIARDAKTVIIPRAGGDRLARAERESTKSTLSWPLSGNFLGSALRHFDSREKPGGAVVRLQSAREARHARRHPRRFSRAAFSVQQA